MREGIDTRGALWMVGVAEAEAGIKRGGPMTAMGKMARIDEGE